MRNKILAFTFLEAVGSFLITPILAIYLVHTLDMREATVAVAITSLYFSRYIIALPVGRLTDFFKPPRMMSLGSALRAFGYGGLALTTEGNLVIVVVSLVFIGLGGALISPASSKMLAQIDGGNSLKFRLNSMMFSIGSASALLAVSFVDKANFALIFYCSSAVFFAASLYALVLDRNSSIRSAAAGEAEQSSLQVVNELASQHGIVLTILLTYTIAYAQLFYLLPIMILKHEISHSFISFIYVANSAFFIFFQPLWQKFSPVKSLPSNALLSAAFFLIGYGFLDIGYTPLTVVLFGLCYAFSGSVLDALFLADIADKTAESKMGTASGMAFMFRGVGLIAGNGVGALILVGEGSQFQYVPIYACLITMTVLALTLFERKQSRFPWYL